MSLRFSWFKSLKKPEKECHNKNSDAEQSRSVKGETPQFFFSSISLPYCFLSYEVKTSETRLNTSISSTSIPATLTCQTSA